MDYLTFKKLVAEIEVGKKLPDSVYVHKSAFETLPDTLKVLIPKIQSAVKIDKDDWNIIKFYTRDYKITFLNYPTFETYSYPALSQAFTVDLAKLKVRKANYSESTNPPILHRKETFVLNDHPLIKNFIAVTKEGEAIGLYEKTRTIGFKNNWERLISNKGYYLDELGRLHPKADKKNKIENDGATDEVLRYRTAIDRNQLSQPMQILAKHNYLDGNYSVLDYGCGKGDDVRELEAHGIDVSGWDPAHYSEGLLISSDIVNLGFVLNVIEDRDEREETLKRAWQYTDRLLIVSVMIAGDSVISQFTPFKDGIITSRKTFQKYYAQSEFRSFVERTLGEEAVAVGQGIFIVFKDKLEEQNFLLERQHIKRDWHQKTQREIKTRSTIIIKDVIEKNLELFTDFWEACLELGRLPANNEFEFSEQVRRVAGSHKKAFEAILERFGSELFEESVKKREEDLLVYFALGLFEKRKPQTQMPESLKRDIKAFFNTYSEAMEAARIALFSVGSPTLIEEACTEAYNNIKCGEFNEGHSFIFHKDFLGDLPYPLRIYVGCATQLYGELDDIQLIKAHMTSGKVSLLGYKNWESETPLLMERIKIKMREQEVDFFDYVGKYTPQPLTNKDKY